MPVTVHDSSAHDNALSHRLRGMLESEIRVARMNIGMAKHGPCHLGTAVWQENQRLRWRPQPRRTIRGVKIVRLRPRLMTPESGDRVPGNLGLVRDQRRGHISLT